MDFLDEQIEAICKKIAAYESEGMEGGVETIGDYGFKCAKAAFKAALNIAITAKEIDDKLFRKG